MELGNFSFTIQAWPDRIAAGASKTQLQIVGILGLISLFTLNNAFWVAGLLIAAIRIPDFMTPLRDIAKALTRRSVATAPPLEETAKEIDNLSDSVPESLKDTREESVSHADTET